MSFDKQWVISELGNLIAHLQSEQGCISKMFQPESPVQRGSPLPTCSGCRRGVCPGHGAPTPEQTRAETKPHNHQPCRNCRCRHIAPPQACPAPDVTTPAVHFHNNVPTINRNPTKTGQEVENLESRMMNMMGTSNAREKPSISIVETPQNPKRNRNMDQELQNQGKMNPELKDERRERSPYVYPDIPEIPSNHVESHQKFNQVFPGMKMEGCRDPLAVAVAMEPGNKTHHIHSSIPHQNQVISNDDAYQHNSDAFREYRSNKEKVLDQNNHSQASSNQVRSDQDRELRQGQKECIYNTLGQLVEVIPKETYQKSKQHIPQTRSPNSSLKEVIPEVTPGPIHGCKGSHSYIQQNPASEYSGTRSEGILTGPNSTPPRAIPMERFSGDSEAVSPNLAEEFPHVVGQVGDEIRAPDDAVEKVSPKSRRSRNGLQDVEHTSGPVSVAWSIRGKPR